MTPKCHECGYQFAPGEQAWAKDWYVGNADLSDLRKEVRYTCDDCEEKR